MLVTTVLLPVIRVFSIVAAPSNSSALPLAPLSSVAATFAITRLSFTVLLRSDERADADDHPGVEARRLTGGVVDDDGVAVDAGVVDRHVAVVADVDAAAVGDHVEPAGKKAAEAGGVAGDDAVVDREAAAVLDVDAAADREAAVGRHDRRPVAR